MILLIDNFDSFVVNLAQGLGRLGEEPAIVRCDRIDVAGILEAAPRALVLSPGPGRPEEAGVSVEAVRALSGRLPVLGVCLGHQAVAAAFGARVVRAPFPVHGRTSPVRHDGGLPFQGLPSPLEACRYHSLVVDPESLPSCLLPCAWTQDGLLMALRHVSHPTFGLQFHPESFLTPRGQDILAGFLRAVSRAEAEAAVAVP